MPLHDYFDKKGREKIAGGKGEEVNTTKELADLAGVSKATMGMYVKVHNSGNAELYRKLITGEISVGEAYRTALNKEEPVKPLVLRIKKDDTISNLKELKVKAEKYLEELNELINVKEFAVKQ
jgi:hypothetical protein